MNFTYNEIAGSCDGDITFPPHFGVISIRKDRSHVPCVGINDLYVQDPRGTGKVVHEGETEHIAIVNKGLAQPKVAMPAVAVCRPRTQLDPTELRVV